MRNNSFRRGLAFAIILLFIGMSILPATRSILSEESNKPTFYGNEYELPPSSIDTQIEYHKRSSHTDIRNYENILYSKQKTSKLQREHNRYEMTEKSLEEITCRDTTNNGDYTPHAPIHIYKNEEFTEENGVVRGTGTSDDPYIIEGWEINSTSAYYGIYIVETTAYFIVKNCLIKTMGIDLENVIHGMIEDVICENPGRGIEIKESAYIVMSNVTIKNCLSGIFVFFSHHNTISGCNVFSNRFGITIFSSSYQILRGNSLYDNEYNLLIEIEEMLPNSMDYFYHDIDISNTINGKPVFYLFNKSNLVFDGNEEIGFLGLIECENILLKNINFSNDAMGVLLAGTQNSEITSSTFLNNYYGMYLFNSSNNTIDNCNVKGGNRGINIVNSPNNIFRNTTISDIWFDFFVWGKKAPDFCQDIDKTNMIDGKPIYYLVGEKNQGITSSQDIGYLALVNCENMSVTEVNIRDNAQGVLLANSTVTLERCTFERNFYGISIFCNSSQVSICHSDMLFNIFGVLSHYTSNNMINNCTVSLNDVGFHLQNTYGSIIEQCDINWNSFSGFQIDNSCTNRICYNWMTHNSFGGIWFFENCCDNEICFNTIESNNIGIFIWFSSCDNRVHHNTIRYNEFEGIDLYYANNNKIYYNNIKDHIGYCGLWVSHSNDVKVEHNNICGNDIGISVFHCTVDARENWWDSKDGPGGIGPGSGDVIKVYNASVYYEPWLKRPVKAKAKDIYIAESDWATLTVTVPKNKLLTDSLLLRFLEQFPILQKLLLLIK